MLLVKKCNFFHYLFSLKIRLEIRFNNILDRKEIFFLTIRKIFQGLKNGIFPKAFWLYAFRQKMPFFSLFVFGQKKDSK